MNANRITCTLNKKKLMNCFFESLDGPNKLISDVNFVDVDRPFYMKSDNKELFFSADPSTKIFSCTIFKRRVKSNIHCEQIKIRKNK